MASWFGGGQPASPTGGGGVFPNMANLFAAGQQPQQATQAGYTPEMIQQARSQLLMQLGTGLMAAGQPMSGAQRAQIISGLGSMTGDYQKNLAAQLAQQREAEQYQQQKAYQDWLQNAPDQDLKDAGFTAGQIKLLRHVPASTSTAAFEHKLTAEPAAPKSPELITLTPPAGSKESPATFNVNDPNDYAQAHDLMTKGWTRASPGTTINMPKPATEAQQRIGNLYGNIYQSNRELAQNEKALTNTWDAFLQKGGAVGNLLQSSDYQEAIRSQTDFVQQLAYVRSGANLAPAEAERLANGYFARPGDKPQVIAAKKKARDIALLSLKAAMGEQRPMLDQIEKEIQQQDNPDLGAP